MKHNFSQFNNVKEVPIPQFFDGGRILVMTNKGDVTSLIWVQAKNAWRCTENKQVVFNMKTIKEWCLYPSKKAEKWIVPEAPKAPDPKAIKAEKDSIAAIKKYIAEFNAEWIPFIKQQQKDKATLEKKLRTKAKALKGTNILSYFKEFITDIDTENDWFYDCLEQDNHEDIFDYLSDGTPLKYEDFKEYYTDCNTDED